MARVHIQLPNDFIDALQAAADTIEVAADEVLNAGAAVVEPRLRANLTGAIGQGATPSRSTG